MNQFKTVLLLGVLSLLLIVVGGAVAPGQLQTFVFLAVLMNVFSYFFSDKLVLSMNGARQVGPDEAPGLHRMIDELSQKAGIPKPRVYVIEADYANAFATGRNPKHSAVAVTTGIMRVLDERELRGVLAHEISHVKNRDILIASIAAMLASAITSIAQWGPFLAGGRSDEEGRGMGGGILMLLLAPLAAMLIQLGVSRSREYEADASGASLTGDPEGLASALAGLHRAAEARPAVEANPSSASLFIVNPFGGLGSSVMNLLSTHPPMEERIKRLRQLSPQFSSYGRVGNY